MSRLIAGASTQSRARRPLPEGWHAEVVKRGGVSEIWMVEVGGKRFEHGIECTWVFGQDGPILGYTTPLNIKTRHILRTVERLAGERGVYGPGSVVSELEVKAADLLCDIVSPFLTDGKGDLKMRWFANGNDACDAAVRVARAATGRNKFISVGYHGASVVFAHDPQRAGVPVEVTQDRIDVEFGGTQAILKNIADAACVIVEVPSTDEDAKSFLRAVRKACDKADVIMILDEVVTGFRLAIGGAADYYGVRPDIACYGKAMSNGRGISALVGWPKVVGELEDRAFSSATYNGDPWNCAHVIATLSYISRNANDVYGHIWGIGEALVAGLRGVGVPIVGHAPRSALSFNLEDERREFCSAMILEHICMDRPNYATLAHTSRHVQRTVEAAGRILGR